MGRMNIPPRVCLGVKTTKAYRPVSVRPIAKKRGSAREFLRSGHYQRRRVRENMLDFGDRNAVFLTLRVVGLIPRES
jgi:hypothetical protein